MRRKPSTCRGKGECSGNVKKLSISDQQTDAWGEKGGKCWWGQYCFCLNPRFHENREKGKGIKRVFRADRPGTPRRNRKQGREEGKNVVTSPSMTRGGKKRKSKSKNKGTLVLMIGDAERPISTSEGGGHVKGCSV